MKVGIMTSWVKATGYAIAVHKVTHSVLKAKGIGTKLSYKERSEKIREFNAWLMEVFQKHNIHKADVLKVYFEVEGDENGFEVVKDSVKVFIARPIGVIEGEEFKEIGEPEFEELYYKVVESVTGERKSKKKSKGAGTEEKEKALDVFLKPDDVNLEVVQS